MERKKIVEQHLEKDVFNQWRLILTDSNGDEWVVSEYTVCSEGGQAQRINLKSEDWFFDPKSNPKYKTSKTP